jgi:hypothetical protein
LLFQYGAQKACRKLTMLPSKNQPSRLTGRPPCGLWRSAASILATLRVLPSPRSLAGLPVVFGRWKVSNSVADRQAGASWG